MSMNGRFLVSLELSCPVDLEIATGADATQSSSGRVGGGGSAIWHFAPLLNNMRYELACITVVRLYCTYHISFRSYDRIVTGVCAMLFGWA